MSDKIAFLGFGTMCAPMTGRLIATGHQVIVWNRMEARVV
ncbi:NAD(P)-binding domain-containing protein [Mycobacterium sp. URHB0021]|jgi:3-hydroxyisobutyrate dehydrogenase-like beta-hydroxyacid dehydrogenase